ncbi:MAG TPA: hypothetical protein PKK10_12825 [Woeseiaceae bacterium]|nr:hypothetical protein [Woeseiaceae bacterium]
MSSGCIERFRQHGGRLARLLVLGMQLVPFAAQAQSDDTDSAAQQSAEIDALEPGVNTATLDSNTAEPSARDEIAATDPAVPPVALAKDVTRSQSGNAVMDRMDLGRTEITGNQELPKVLYIVPWKKADPGDLMGKPVNSLLDEVLAPIDREEFVRSVDYYDELHGVADE